MRRAKKKPVSRQNLVLMGIAFVALILVLLWSNGVFSRGTTGANTASTSAPALAIGSEAHVTAADADEVLVAATEESYDALNRALAAHDNEALTGLLMQGALFAVPKGTRVRVLAGSFTHVQVRILEGEHAGASGWIALEFVGP